MKIPVTAAHLATALTKNSRFWQFRVGTQEEIRGTTYERPIAIRTNHLRNETLKWVEVGIWGLLIVAFGVGILFAL